MMNLDSGQFILHSKHQPAGGQIEAIKALLQGLDEGKKDQVLLGVTGSGKTFTIANVIAQSQRPALIMVHNKTLAAQLYTEMCSFFPENAVEYFVSYYDYYQPEAYVAKTDTYIEKDSAINKKIEIFRHSTTRSFMERKDVIVVTSVSSIYGLGTPEYYKEIALSLREGDEFGLSSLIAKLTSINYERNDMNFDNAKFMVRGDTVLIYPPYNEDIAIRVEFFGDVIDKIWAFDALTGQKIKNLSGITIYPANHYTTPKHVLERAAERVRDELANRIKFFRSIGKEVEAQRIDQRVRYDIEMMLEIGHFKGIENYSFYMDGRKNHGEPPYTLFHYLPKNAIVFVDESHVSLPQIRGMYEGDRQRKTNLVDYGFRLPSAMDNRPLKFDEWDSLRTQTIFVSATPGPTELQRTGGEVVEQIIRPTGLLDPVCEMRPLENHFDDLMNEIKKMNEQNLRTIVVVLTKKIAEKTYNFFQEVGIKSGYIHSDTNTLERIKIIQQLRSGVIDVIVGINLLREGIDIPECGLVAVTDADKEGFLRSESSLIQIIGRAARNSAGKVILYADKMTNSIKNAMSETSRRRKMQEDYNTKHNIIPKTIEKSVDTPFDQIFGNKANNSLTAAIDLTYIPDTAVEIEREMRKITKAMKKAAKELQFEKASELREYLKKLEMKRLQVK